MTAGHQRDTRLIENTQQIHAVFVVQERTVLNTAKWVSNVYLYKRLIEMCTFQNVFKLLNVHSKQKVYLRMVE